MKPFAIPVCFLTLILSGCSESSVSKSRLQLPEINHWFVVDRSHPVILDAVRGIGLRPDHLAGARVKGDGGFGLVYYELYFQSPNYPVWKYEVTRNGFQIDDNGTLSRASSGEG